MLAPRRNASGAKAADSAQFTKQVIYITPSKFAERHNLIRLKTPLTPYRAAMGC